MKPVNIKRAQQDTGRWHRQRWCLVAVVTTADSIPGYTKGKLGGA